MPYKDPEMRNLFARVYQIVYRNKNKIKKKKYDREYRENNPEKAIRVTIYKSKHKNKINEQNRKYYQKLLSMVIKGYGGECLFCKENNPDMLVLHHVNEDGKEHRKEEGKTGHAIYRWIIENDFPDEIVLLCANCHLALHRRIYRDGN